jgi:hypothetical protein
VTAVVSWADCYGVKGAAAHDEHFSAQTAQSHGIASGRLRSPWISESCPQFELSNIDGRSCNPIVRDWQTGSDSSKVQLETM